MIFSPNTKYLDDKSVPVDIPLNACRVRCLLSVFVTRKHCWEHVNNAREIRGCFVQRILATAPCYSPSRFSRTFPLEFTEHLHAILQPELHALGFSTNPQRSSQQQSYDLLY